MYTPRESSRGLAPNRVIDVNSPIPQGSEKERVLMRFLADQPFAEVSARVKTRHTFNLFLSSNGAGGAACATSVDTQCCPRMAQTSPTVWA